MRKFQCPASQLVSSEFKFYHNFGYKTGRSAGKVYHNCIRFPMKTWDPFEHEDYKQYSVEGFL